MNDFSHEPMICDCSLCIEIRTQWAREQLVDLAVNEVFGTSTFSALLHVYEDED